MVSAVSDQVCTRPAGSLCCQAARIRGAGAKTEEARALSVKIRARLVTLQKSGAAAAPPASVLRR